MHVGNAVALVVAETMAAAQDAAELVEVAYEMLPAVTALDDAIKDGAPQFGRRRQAILRSTGRVRWSTRTVRRRRRLRDSPRPTRSRVRMINQPINGAPMEPRGATARYDARADRYHLALLLSQGATTLRDQLAGVMGLPREQLEQLTEDVGGAFAEDLDLSGIPGVAFAAGIIGRTVHWMSTRSGSAGE